MSDYNVVNYRYSNKGLNTAHEPVNLPSDKYTILHNAYSFKEGSLTTRLGLVKGGSVVTELTVNVSCPTEQPELGVEYLYTFEATGGFPPYTWSLLSGELPPGIELNQIEGALEGTLTGIPTQGGEYEWTLQVEDALGNTATITCSFDIEFGPELSMVACPTEDPILDEAFSFQMEATGGTAPYTFALTAGAFPDGITMNSAGLISGTPTEFGEFSWTVTVTDSVLATALIACGFTIVEPPLEDIIFRPTSVTFNPAPGPGIRGTIDDPTFVYDDSEGTYATWTTSGGTVFSTHAMAHYQDWETIPEDLTGVLQVSFHARMRWSRHGNTTSAAMNAAIFSVIDTDPNNDPPIGEGVFEFGGQVVDSDWVEYENELTVEQFEALLEGDLTCRIFVIMLLGNFSLPYPTMDVAEVWGVLHYLP